MDDNVCMSQHYWGGKTSPCIIKRGVKSKRHSTGKTSVGVVCPVLGKHFNNDLGQLESMKKNTRILEV